mgnify:CR=1 FL=1
MGRTIIFYCYTGQSFVTLWNSLTFVSGRDLYFDIKPTPGSWHCFWFLLKMVKFWPKFWPSFTNTFPMWGKLFQIFLDPNKKKFCFSILKSCMMYDLFLSWYAVEECKQMIRTVQIFISKGTVVKNSHKQKNIWIKNWNYTC